MNRGARRKPGDPLRKGVLRMLVSDFLMAVQLEKGQVITVYDGDKWVGTISKKSHFEDEKQHGTIWHRKISRFDFGCHFIRVVLAPQE